ncbi:(Fe-S)-binding protein [Anthocerotibacter panamensis]|uniref:(Fe-S)-binding protein n=1 Tax=Anthocerotibacter panamensis TaxID=2857077 RepID=UPI001C40637E|nr:heterodisulfide reductase-related iron-sulfur binding cluster [Anthocerotibacter panamensis]
MSCTLAGIVGIPVVLNRFSRRSLVELKSASFDAQHPPDPTLIDACVHCGFCLSTCPSYRVLGKEMDSPRGRIYLMDALNEGQVPLSPKTVEHFDSCLGCLACVTTCPSGVQYDQLITNLRPQVERNHPRPLLDRLMRSLIFHLLPYPKRLRPLLIPLIPYQKLGIRTVVRASNVLKKLAPRLAAMESMLPEVPLSAFRDTLPALVPAQGPQRYRVGVILGCVQRLFFDSVNQATVRVLTANGCEVVIPQSQGCCAALPQHQGQQEQAKTMARQMIDSFAGTEVDAIIINAAGCGHTLKEYGSMLADDPQYRDKARAFAAKVRDVQEFLHAIGLTTPLSPLASEPITLVYQDACHLLHGQKISLQPRQLLQKIPGVTLREPLDAALCCGSAGVYNILQPEVAEELGQQKVENLLDTAAKIIASPNPGCALQIRKHLALKGKTVPVMHPMELLDLAIRGVRP